MIVWSSLIIYILILKFFFNDLSRKDTQKRFLVFAAIPTIFVMGMRYPHYKIVYDLEVYYNYYWQISKTPWVNIFDISNFEPGYAILNKALSTISPWPQFIIIFEAFFAVFAVSRFIYMNSDYPFHAFLFYLTLGTMTFQLTGFRQTFAIGVCLFAVEYIKERKLLHFLLLALIASSLHKTAIVFIPFYFIGNKEIRWSSILLIAVGVLGAEWATNFGNDLFDMHYGAHKGYIGGAVPIAIYSITIIISLLYYKRNHHRIGLNMTILGLSIYVMRYVTLVLERISFFFTTGTIIALPEAIHLERNEKIRKILSLISIYLSIGLFFYRLSSSEIADYRFFWQER